MIPKFPDKQTKLSDSEFMIVKLAFQLSLWLEYVVRSSCSEVENSEQKKQDEFQNESPGLFGGPARFSNGYLEVLGIRARYFYSLFSILQLFSRCGWLASMYCISTLREIALPGLLSHSLYIQAH